MFCKVKTVPQKEPPKALDRQGLSGGDKRLSKDKLKYSKKNTKMYSPIREKIRRKIVARIRVVIAIKASKYTVYGIVKNQVIKPIWSTSAPPRGNNSRNKK